jgi:hypothetical protein
VDDYKFAQQRGSTKSKPKTRQRRTTVTRKQTGNIHKEWHQRQIKGSTSIYGKGERKRLAVSFEGKVQKADLNEIKKLLLYCIEGIKITNDKVKMGKRRIVHNRRSICTRAQR